MAEVYQDRLFEVEKQCIKCGESKPFEYFYLRARPHKYANEWTRRNSRCISCIREYNRQYRIKNAERLKQRRADNYDSELNSRQCKQYREKFAEQVRANKAEYHRRNAARISAKAVQWARDNRERRKAIANDYLSRRRGASGSIDGETVAQMYEDQAGCCAYCATALGEVYHLDHMQPLSRSGVNEWWNLAIACIRCNTSKGAKTAEEYMEYLRIVGHEAISETSELRSPL